ncbi:MAG: xylanase [Lachnospiraceae bacterium]|nr:xylanase [Lachnospiraceae bacterium]
MIAAGINGKYTNYFERMGYEPSDIDKRLSEIFDTMFFGSEDERIYHETGDMGYMVDTGNVDVRTEGMSYGMMMSVQMDRKDVFDRIWKWTRTYMYNDSGQYKGYFSWSHDLDGSRNFEGPAPDGEEYFAMALLFASHRWGDGEGIFDYGQEARSLLHNMIEPAGTSRGMFDTGNHLIRFIPEADFTDPSYHLPHFYELFSMWADPADREFYKAAAGASREFLHSACHNRSGLCSEYSYYDGTPYEKGGEIWGKHDWYYSDAYRTIMNIALDHIWFGKDKWQEEEGACFIGFMDRLGKDKWNRILEWDGTVRSEDVLHPVAVIAVNAAAAALIEDTTDVSEAAQRFVRMFWDTPLRSGNRRYYDNCLYLFSFLLLSGRYRIWQPEN